MTIPNAMELINGMQADGVIQAYAIGGAVGAIFYLEPIATQDIDIFVALSAAPNTLLVTLTPIYEYLQARGCIVEKEYIVAADWPVQFLPASTALLSEALQQAVTTDLSGIPVRVMTAEHLVAIALDTGRAKDFSRIIQFLDQQAIDIARLEAILKRHSLDVKWLKFRERFLTNL